MKNFRKVLALVLVVATLFSFATMAGAKYEDEASINYTEAVSVLSQMGILNGYEVAEDEFKFEPTKEISREEMAKMIAVLANAGSDISKLYASANTFADVENDRWSASYIAYCAQTGIVAGRTATTFDPYGNITGLETAKMLLVVLGFNAEEQGYVGANWKINVLRDAKVMGLTAGFAADYDIEAKITREEAANMMLNALEAPCVVGVLSGSIINITNALVFKGDTEKANVVNYLKVNSYATLKDALSASKWSLYENVVISDDLLCDVLYGMEKIDDADCYGRPGAIWTYKNAAGTVKKIAATTSAPIFSSHDTTDSKLATELKIYADNAVELWVDGQKTNYKSLTKAVKYLKDNEILGHGVQVEVYRQVAADGTVSLKIIVINTYIDTIDAVNVAKGTFTVNNTTYKNEFGLTPANVDDVALVWVCAKEGAEGKVHDLKIIEPTVVTVKTARAVGTAPLTDHDYAQSNFTSTEGEKFEYAKNFNIWYTFKTEGVDNIMVGAAGDAAANIGDTLDLYLDEFGFVMGYAKTDDIDWNVAVVEYKSLYRAPAYQVNKVDVYDHTVDLLAFDANVTETEDVAITDKAADTKVHTSRGTLVKYYINEDGEAEFERYNKSGEGVQMEAGKGALISGVAADKETQYIIRFEDYSTGEYVYKYFVGKNALDADYKADYLQIITDASGKFADYVYAECSVAKVAEKAFVLGYAYDEITLTESGKVAYTTYEVLVGGEPAYLSYTGALTKFDRLYNVTMKYIGMSTADGKPVYQAMSTAKEAGLDLDLAYSAGTLMDNSGEVLDIAEDAKLIVAFTKAWDHDQDADTDSWEYDVCTMEELGSYMTDAGWTSVRNYVIKNADGEVTELYLVLKVTK